MLVQFRLTQKIHAVNADNATLNDTQTTKLDQLDDTFDEDNQVQCFNHTLQLSAKALLKPFNIGLSGKTTDDDDEITQDNDILATFKDDEEGKEDEEDEEEQADNEDNKNDNIDELEETVAVRNAVTKVSGKCSPSHCKLFYLSRYKNLRLPSSIQPRSLFLLGAASAASCISRNGLSPVMS